MGRDHYIVLTSKITISFNPHAPMGRDGWVLSLKAVILFVSIHTPLWGATALLLICAPVLLCFNPHAPMGRDVGCKQRIKQCYGFNPHAPMGRDKRKSVNAFFINVSIHTPLWGATAISTAGAYHIAMFQSTRPYGARLELTGLTLVVFVVSIHTPLWGATISL